MSKLKKIGKYPLIRHLGEGGMGTVWLAEHPDFGIQVAIKTIKGNDEAYIARFLQEARSAALINHPRVARTFDAGSDGDIHYIVMEFLPGGDIGELMGDGPLDPEFALYIIQGVAEGLAAAVKVGIIHRDIKPDNIMLDAEGETKLVDLGLAREIGGESNLTTAGVMMGTPAYISPEQAKGERSVDTRSDIYSLGATLFYMVTGETPHDADSPMGMAVKHCTQPTPDPHERNKTLSKPLCDLIMKMMAKSPAERYQSPGDLLRAITAVRRGIGRRPVAKRKPSPKKAVPKAQPAVPARGKKRAAPSQAKSRMPLIIGALLASVAIVAVLLMRAKSQPPLQASPASATTTPPSANPVVVPDPTLATPSVSSPPSSQDGLIAHYTFDDDVRDSSGAGRHGTLTGGAYRDAIIGRALKFSSRDDVVKVPDLGTHEAITISMWVKQGFAGGPKRALYAGDAWSIGRVHFNIGPKGLTLGVKNSAAGNVEVKADNPALLRTNTWTHVAATLGQKGVTVIYRNGEGIASTTVSPYLPIHLSPGQIGNWTVAPDRVFNGVIDDVRIYSRALSADEIQILARGDSSR